MTDENYVNFKTELVERLKSLGYEVSEKDEFILKFITNKTERYMIDITNRDPLPDELHYVLIDRVCGEFLFSIRGSNMLTEEQIEAVVTQIKEGDTTVAFDVNTSPQAKFDGFMRVLMNTGDNQFSKYRRLTW